MKKIAEPMQGLIVVEPTVFGDERGWFFESFSKKFWNEQNVKNEFVQDNRSFSKFGTLRGLHFQTGEYAQAKLVTCLKGEVLDIVVDLRKNSPTLGKSYSQLLTEKNKVQMMVPRGFAHGFVVLSEEAEFFYKCDNFYAPKFEMGLQYNDVDLKLDWKVSQDKLILSGKDKKNHSLKELLTKELGF